MGNPVGASLPSDHLKISFETIVEPSLSTTSRIEVIRRVPDELSMYTTKCTALAINKLTVSIGKPVDAIDM
jgi:hypothetical protein